MKHWKGGNGLRASRSTEWFAERGSIGWLAGNGTTRSSLVKHSKAQKNSFLQKGENCPVAARIAEGLNCRQRRGVQRKALIQRRNSLPGSLGKSGSSMKRR